MSAHTPGPWKVEGGQQGWSKDKGSAEFVLGADGRTCVAECHTGNGISDNAESLAQTKADARLIAAAPDLLGAVLACFVNGTPEFDPSNPRTEAMLRAAIAKATGK